MTEDAENLIDPAIVAALYVEFAEPLRLFLVGVLRDHQLAADVLQSTFVKLTEKGHLTSENSRKSWLFQVAYREAMALRRRETIGDKVHQQMARIDQRPQPAADHALLRKEAIESVRRVLRDLPFEQQQVVRMRIYEGKKFADIASELDIPLGTALGRMRSAMAKLRAGLEEDHL